MLQHLDAFEKRISCLRNFTFTIRISAEEKKLKIFEKVDFVLMRRGEARSDSIQDPQCH